MEDTVDHEELAAEIYHNLLNWGDHELTSGKNSDFYVDIKGIGEFPLIHRSLNKMAEQYLEEESINYDIIGCEGMGGVTTGVPLATYLTTENREERWTVLRPQRKNHGDKKMYAGADPENRDLLLVDDVITTGGSAAEAIDKFRDLGGNPVYFLSYADRGEGGLELVKEREVDADALFHIDEIMENGRK